MTGPDKYESVLGLPPGPRPPTHYELLGLEPFEASENAIVEAAGRRLIDAEESVMASADHIRQVMSEIRLAKTCLLNKQSKAEYDRGLQVDSDDQPIELERPDVPAPGSPHAPQDELQDRPQFEALPTELIVAGRPKPGKSRKFRVWFWTFTLVEGLCVLGLYLYLRPLDQAPEPEPPAPPPVAAEPPKPVSQPEPRPVRRERPATERRASSDPFAPSVDPSPAEVARDNDSAVLTDPDMPERPTTSPADVPETQPAPDTQPVRETPAAVRPVWPSKWTLRFSALGDWTIESEMLSLSADESKTLAALRELPIYTVREAGTRNPIAALPFDMQGHLSGLAVALLPKDDWRACLTYGSQVLQGWAMVLDAGRACVCLGEYRNKGRTKLLCLCAAGIPVAVQIWRGKEFAAFLVELVDGQPVAVAQKDLSPEQAERLAAALGELASIEGLIHDREREWKAQLAEWWSKHDTALRTISALPIDEAGKQTRKTAYYKKLFDEQHAGLDKLLIQFGTPPVDPAVHAP